jgi:large subunit ribosomal protein L25
MARPKLSVQPRSVRGKEVAKLRREGTLPGVVYGAGTDSTPVAMDAREFEVLHRQAGRHAVVDLHLDGGRPKPVLLQAIQEHPVSRKPLHVDFLVVNMEEERTVDVPIQTVGESEAVDKLGGVLLHMRDTVLVRAKPDDLPSSIELDVSPLVDFDQVLHASDLQIPEGATLVTDASEAVARVQPPRVEEEPVVAEAEEGEEAAAGAEAAEGEAGGAEASAETGGGGGDSEES